MHEGIVFYNLWLGSYFLEANDNIENFLDEKQKKLTGNLLCMHVTQEGRGDLRYELTTVSLSKDFDSVNRDVS